MSRERKRVQKEFHSPSRTQQSFKKEADVNYLMQKFKKVAGVEFLSQYQGYVSGQFGDFSSVKDYKSALDALNQAESVFGGLPAKVRAMFQNDCAQFLDFCQNPENSQALKDLGLREKSVEDRVSDPGKVEEKAS